MKWSMLIVIVVLAVAGYARAADDGPAEHVATPTSSSMDAEGHRPIETGPVTAHGDDGRGRKWAGVTIVVILGMFLAAAVIGPIVRANAPVEVPVAHSHDEPPGASQHHGRSGTLNPEPDHGHADDEHPHRSH